MALMKTLSLRVLCSLISMVLPRADAAMVLALGDSYSTGEGTHQNFLEYTLTSGSTETINGVTYEFQSASLVDIGCHGEVETTPGPRLANELNLEFEMVACNGARIENLIEQIKYLNAKYPAEQRKNWAGSVFILTIGLNNLETLNGVGWFFILLGCIFNCFEDCSEDPGNHAGNLDEIKQDLLEAYELLATTASEASIRIFGYAKVFQRNGQDCDSFGMSNTEADFIDEAYFQVLNDASREITDVIRARGPVDIEFVDANEYLTVGACREIDEEEAHLRGYETFFPLPYGTASFHPTQLGYNRYYDALVDSLNLV